MAKKQTTKPKRVELTDRQRAFLSAYAMVGIVTAAAEAAGMTRRAHQYAMAETGPRGPIYRRAFKAARKEAIERMEAEARRRAMEGERELVTYLGQPVFVWVKGGVVVPPDTKGAVQEPLYTTKRSDNLLMFSLKGAKPEKYRERIDNQHSGPKGAPIKISVEAMRQELVGNDEFLDFQRSRANPANLHAGLVCPNGQQRQMGNGQASGHAGPQTNGHHKPT